MTTHFNLAILTDSTASNKAVNCPTAETGVTDPGPSNFVLGEETICKSKLGGSKTSTTRHNNRTITSSLQQRVTSPHEVQNILQKPV